MTLPPDVLDLHGVADLLGMSYDWLQRNWRDLPGFPPPFIGAGHGQRPRWARASIEAFRLGRRFTPDETAAQPPSRRFPAANDPVPAPVPDRVAALLAGLTG